MSANEISLDQTAGCTRPGSALFPIGPINYLAQGGVVTATGSGIQVKDVPVFDFGYAILDERQAEELAMALLKASLVCRAHVAARALANTAELRSLGLGHLIGDKEAAQ